MGAMKKSEFKTQIRREAKKKVKGYSGGALDHAAYRDRVEAGRKELLIKSAQGGDNKAQRIKNELFYLLNNYAPQFDMRITQLIEQWRTSHDPSYDPAIHAKFRSIRKQHDRTSQAF